jgi:two-component system, NtrC family, sensor kinase
MRRRDNTGGKEEKTQRPKTLRRGNALKAARRRNPLAAGKETNVAQVIRERDEALEQLAAASEVLRVISSSPGELEPVFNAMLENATRICNAKFGVLWRYDGELFHLAAMHGVPHAFADFLIKRGSTPPLKGTPIHRVLTAKKPVHTADELSEPIPGAPAKYGGARSLVAVPMLKNDELVGAFVIYRQEVRPFTKKQIELVENFAAQAVIAIENTRLLSELRESLQQQTATADVLKVISRSTFDLQKVLNTLVESAARLCEADNARILRPTGKDASYYVAAKTSHHHTAEYEEHLRTVTYAPGRGGVVGRVLLEGKSVQIPDVLSDPEYTYREGARLGDYRTILGVPLLREGSPIGLLVLNRATVRPFTDKQIELVETFADQAVIAIENARLLGELRQRTDDLSESLEQQTATSEVLKVISSSPGQLEPVFNAMLKNAVRVCGAKFGILYRSEGNGFRTVAMHDVPRAFAEKRGREPFFIPPVGSPLGRVTQTRQVAQTTDVTSEQDYAEGEQGYAEGHRALKDLAELGGARTVASVPMLKDDELVGAITIFRQEVRPFTDKQIEIVKNFAAQAVIAIENTRLLNELRQRTDDLSEALEQQTATSEVLKIISSSPGELKPVFDAMLEKAMRVCEATFGHLATYDGTRFHTVAIQGVPAPFAEYRRQNPPVYGPGTGTARLLAGERFVHFIDAADTDVYRQGDPNQRAVVDLGGARTMLVVPLLKDDALRGFITLYRQEVKPFTDKQIALVQNFAAQAVIAIENVRLFDEVQRRTRELSQSVDELRALGEVTQAINSTLELETVLTTIVGRAVELSRTDAGAIYVFDEDSKAFRLHATCGMSETMVAAISDQHIGLDDGNNIAKATTQRKPVQVADARDEPTSAVNDIVLREGYRSILIIPLLRPDHIVGALVVRRKAPGEFPQSTIDLLQTFADQSVVAIQNARLYANVETRTRELAKSLEDLRTAQDRLVQTEKLASLGQLTAGIAHEIKNPLNFVNNFSGVSAELIDELQDVLNRISIDHKARAEIKELTDTLQGNLDKVVQHGKRADAIVKNMLLHSRAGSGEHRPVDINAIVEESLNLAWHGARAEKQGFNITLEKSFDPTAGEADVFPQEITRALLNLISNGFYAATKRKAEANGGDYEPTLAATTKNLGDRVEIRIRDNGTGISPGVKERLFTPFFTTKPAGEGTGLGLSISHDIIVKQHGGSVEVDTQPGEFTEFRIVLPRTAVGQQ